jgi:hypothetical protein
MRQLDATDTDSQNWVWNPPLNSPGLLLSSPHRRAQAALVQINDDGVMHLSYHEPLAGRLDYQGGGEARIFHRYNAGDPMDPNDWSAPTEISSDRRTDAKFPSLITDGDSVWVTYTIFDDEDDPNELDDAWEGWARRGYPIADGVASGERADWFGSVFVDADFVVAAGGTLSVAPGTKIFARADKDRENQGEEPTLTEIVIRGTLLAQATGQDPILFTSYDDDDGIGADEWGGFLFQLQGTYESSYGFYAMLEPPSSLANVSIENAKYGVRIDGRIAPGLDDVTFTNISSGADIYLDGIDTVIPGFRYEDDGNPLTWDYSPEFTLWNLAGPTIVRASAIGTSGDAEIGTSGLVDLIAQGGLDTNEGPASEPVTFTAESPSTTGDDWGGIYLDWPAK